MERLTEDLPVQIEFVASISKVDEVMPELYEMAGTGLIEVQDTFLPVSQNFRSEDQPVSRKREGRALLLRVFLGENDKCDGKPLFQAVLENMHANDIAGATVYRGVTGYGDGGGIATITYSGIHDTSRTAVPGILGTTGRKPESAKSTSQQILSARSLKKRPECVAPFLTAMMARVFSGFVNGLQIGTHDFRDSADLGGGPDIVDGCLLEAPAFSWGLQGDVHSDFVSEFEAVGNGLCGRVDFEGCTANRIFLHAKTKGWPEHADDANGRGGYAWGPGFHVNRHPNVVRSLGREPVELKCGQEAYRALRDFVGRFDKRQVLGDLG